ncbi:hypothetical protein [Cecembia lonarensis]|nr:hypothetical protein [Cecembia lonarensis]
MKQYFDQHLMGEETPEWMERGFLIWENYTTEFAKSMKRVG